MEYEKIKGLPKYIKKEIDLNIEKKICLLTVFKAGENIYFANHVGKIYRLKSLPLHTLITIYSMVINGYKNQYKYFLSYASNIKESELSGNLKASISKRRGCLTYFSQFNKRAYIISQGMYDYLKFRKIRIARYKKQEVNK